MPSTIQMNCTCASPCGADRKSTRLNSSHTEIYTLSLHDALPILALQCPVVPYEGQHDDEQRHAEHHPDELHVRVAMRCRSEEHTSELQSHRDLHSFPTRRSSDLSAAVSGGPVRGSARRRTASCRAPSR